jgi:hypothetical protein
MSVLIMGRCAGLPRRSWNYVGGFSVAAALRWQLAATPATGNTASDTRVSNGHCSDNRYRTCNGQGKGRRQTTQHGLTAGLQTTLPVGGLYLSVPPVANLIIAVTKVPARKFHRQQRFENPPCSASLAAPAKSAGASTSSGIRVALRDAGARGIYEEWL